MGLLTPSLLNEPLAQVDLNLPQRDCWVNMTHIYVCAPDKLTAIKKAVRLIDPSVKEILPWIEPDQMKKYFQDTFHGNIIKFSEAPIGSVCKLLSTSSSFNTVLKRTESGGAVFRWSETDGCVKTTSYFTEADELCEIIGSEFVSI